MNPRITLSLVAIVIATGAALRAQAAEEAGFNCAKAVSAFEKAICADPKTVEADRAMSVAYKALLSQPLAPAFASALKADQRSFLMIREQAWELKSNRHMAEERLRDETEARAERLNWLNPAPQGGLVGTWANSWGMIKITQGTDGILEMSSNVADQIAGSWVCGFDGSLVVENPSVATGHMLTEKLEIRRSGPLLEVASDFCDETGPPIRGSMKGLYFRIGAND